MVRKFFWLALLVIGSGILFFNPDVDAAGHEQRRPILIVVADKMDSLEFYQSQLPSIQRLLNQSACGLMNIRSGSGYTNTNSGYLTVGAGNRSVAPGVLNGAYTGDHVFGSITAADFWSWSSAETESITEPNLLVPEIGWIYTQAEIADRTAIPGLLGGTFRKNGWKTVLLGNADSSGGSNRPAGLLLMDEQGIIDQGKISLDINQVDPGFPYQYRFDFVKTNAEIEKYLLPNHLVVVEFGDFARLDSFREEMSLEQYERLKYVTWQRFDQFLGSLLTRYRREKVDLMLLAPTISRDSYNNKRWLTPLVIRATGYPRGLLQSGTTKWDGLVANLDILPTLTEIAGLKVEGAFSGKVIEVLPKPDYLQSLNHLHNRINAILINQRGLIDWYLAIISIGWIAACLFWGWGKIQLAQQCVVWVASAPLILIIQPLLPDIFWNVPGFTALTFGLGWVWRFLWKDSLKAHHGLMILSGLFWLVLTLDQLTGWQLIRFSGLGYSAASGSRYYGMGNEYMGIYLALTLISASLAEVTFSKKWPGFILLLTAIFILGWPKYGINFGGTLSAVIGFFFYAVSLFQVNMKDRRIWYICGAGVILVLGVGIWDALRPPEIQTHIGAFFNLLLHNDFKEIGMVILRKLNMNLKLLLYSPWTRIILLTFIIWIGIHIVGRKRNVDSSQKLVWWSILVSGMAAFVLNDSGVVAFGTCLAYGFTYYLGSWIN